MSGVKKSGDRMRRAEPQPDAEYSSCGGLRVEKQPMPISEDLVEAITPGLIEAYDAFSDGYHGWGDDLLPYLVDYHRKVIAAYDSVAADHIATLERQLREARELLAECADDLALTAEFMKSKHQNYGTITRLERRARAFLNGEAK